MKKIENSANYDPTKQLLIEHINTKYNNEGNKIKSVETLIYSGSSTNSSFFTDNPKILYLAYKMIVSSDYTNGTQALGGFSVYNNDNIKIINKNGSAFYNGNLVSNVYNYELLDFENILFRRLGGIAFYQNIYFIGLKITLE